MRRSTLRLAVACLLLTSALAAADQPEVIRLGFASAGAGGRPFASSSAIASAHAKGLLEAEFKADGIRIEWVFHKGAGPAVNEALAGGLLDFALQGDFPSTLGRASGLKTRIICAAGVRANTYLAVPAASTATSLKDLLGKRVAYHRGTNATLGIAKILQSLGLGDADFRTINLDGSTAAVAIASNEVDAVWGSSITLFDLQQRGIVRIIDSTRGKDPRLTLQAHLLVTEAFEQRYPALVQRVVDVVVKEAAWAADEAHRDELFALWSKAGYAVGIFAEEFRDTPLRGRVSPLLDGFFYERYRDAMKTSLELKLIRRGFDVDAWIEPKYVRSAVQRFGLEGTWPEYDAAGQPRLAAAPAGR
jgi:sulfonate transport system substrate-binding protein